MRRRVTWLVAAITSAVVIAFLVPLAFLLRQLAEDRAVTAAVNNSQALLAVAANPFAAAQGINGVKTATHGLTGNQRVGQVSLYLFRNASPTSHDLLGQAVSDSG